MILVICPSPKEQQAAFVEAMKFHLAGLAKGIRMDGALAVPFQNVYRN